MKIFLGRDHKDERQPMKGKVEEPDCPPFGEIKMIIGAMFTGSLSKLRRTTCGSSKTFNCLEDHQGWSEKMSLVLFSWTRMPNVRTILMTIVITLKIANYTTRRVLVDNRCSTYIFYYLAFQQMRINKELLRLMNVPLILGLEEWKFYHWVPSPYQSWLAPTHGKSIRKSISLLWIVRLHIMPSLDD